MTDPHDIVVSHVPLDAPGARLAGTISGKDVSISSLRDVLKSTEENLSLTQSFLADPSTKDLAVAVRGALVSIEALTFHLLELHTGIAKGNVNYHEEPIEGYNLDD